MIKYVLLLTVFVVFAEHEDYEVLVNPNIAQDELKNHILTVTVQNRDYNRIIDTKEDEIIVGIRAEEYPPLNQVLSNFLSEVLQVKPNLVEVIEGHSENEGKKVQVDGTVITAEEIRKRILKALKDSIEEERHLKPSIKHRNIM
ncbi:uncharacterized protein LOC124354787 [Homalodisca vitripennis]|uniref:uncharacterized protein LOC124354787 n=1 Tax=Homalodisca vitripennis TaxID=197043 RepID=UPI001EEB161D|nr:uncharacterized protein LOC124354787 [Homalodisca vitripennis]